MNKLMQNPEKWIGKGRRINLDHEHHDEVVVCENCQTYQWGIKCSGLLNRETQADLELQQAVGTEDALIYCPQCLAEVEADADKVDPSWRERHSY